MPYDNVPTDNAPALPPTWEFTVDLSRATIDDVAHQQRRGEHRRWRAVVPTAGREFHSVARENHQAATEHAGRRQVFGEESIELDGVSEPSRIDAVGGSGEEVQAFPGGGFDVLRDRMQPGKLRGFQHRLELATHFPFKLVGEHYHRADEQQGGE